MKSGHSEDADIGGDPVNHADVAVRVTGLHKGYRLGREPLPVLCSLDLQVGVGEMVVIMGPSGSGKTTLLNCLSAIDVPDRGAVEVGGRLIDYASDRARTLLRRKQVGMVFQFFNLIPTLTVRENIALPFLVAGARGKEYDTHVDSMLERVGMVHRSQHYPQQLSGGEMQLTSIARALVHRPGLLLADEPTGNVNPAVGRAIVNILRETAGEQGTSIVMVTHGAEYAAWADRICFLKEGVIADELNQCGRSESIAPIYDRLLALEI